MGEFRERKSSTMEFKAIRWYELSAREHLFSLESSRNHGANAISARYNALILRMALGRPGLRSSGKYIELSIVGLIPGCDMILL